MSPIEVIAAVVGFVCVWLTVKQRVECWPVGLVQVVLYLYIFLGAQLYSDAILQAIYIPMQIYGWWAWTHVRPDRTSLKVTRLTAPEFAAWILVCAAGAAAVGWVMANRTDASLPYPDATAAVMSLAAQWLMSRKRLESWLLWICVDVLSIGIFSYKEMYPTLVLYCVYLVLATMGYLEWRKTMRAASSGAEPA